MRRIALELGGRSHEVVVGSAILERAELYPVPAGARVALVCDAAVMQSHVPRVRTALATAAVTTLEVPAGEASKSWERLSWLCDAFATAGLDRQDWVVALGGGVVGDLAGFAAACYMRGLRHVVLPTTLLAQVDAAVGGKTAINIDAGKNLVGAFHQPAAVLADVGTLATMPQREFVAGLAECVKHGLLEPAILAFLEENATEFAKGAQAGPDLLADLVARNVACKAAVVIEDEREGGRRAHLNLGHTFAHAFEAALGYGNLLHGEAVAIGLVAACRLGVRLGVTAGDLAKRVVALLQHLGLPTTLPAHDREALLAAMAHDKKSVAGQLRFIVVREPGDILVTNEVAAELVVEVIDGLQA